MKHQDPTSVELELLIEGIFRQFQHDFRHYSRSSLRRRLEQAMIRYGAASISELQNRLFHEPGFFSQLIPYLTVNTTELFRDPGYFLSLKNNVFPYLKTFPSIKLWVAGCSTGEEVISLAILLRECNLKRTIIYATDINPHNLEKASQGIYDIETVQKGSRNYQQAGGLTSLSDYYQAAYDSVRFDPTLLSNVVFSDHSLATDSVFAETHFVSCRNVLIYFDRPLQDRALKLFTDSLTRSGFLGLGSKETLQFSSVAKEFSEIDGHNRLYQKLAGGAV